jgi:hypothetical protein
LEDLTRRIKPWRLHGDMEINMEKTSLKKFLVPKPRQ